MKFDFVGTYQNPAYGTIAVLRRGDQMALSYFEHEWPVTFKDGFQADIVLGAFGMQILLPVQFEIKGTRKQFSLPLSLDPRVPSPVFSQPV